MVLCHGLGRMVNNLTMPAPVLWHARQSLTITHNFRELRERSKGQIVDNKKGAADNKL